MTVKVLEGRYAASSIIRLVYGNARANVSVLQWQNVLRFYMK